MRRWLRRFFLPFPWQQFINPIDGMIGDASDDVGEPGFRVDVVEARGFNQRMHDRSATPAFVRTGEEIVL